MREFNRFYTRLIGLLERQFLGSPYTLAEVRVLFEIRNAPRCSARKIMAAMDIDEGYLSRILASLIKRGLVERKPLGRDGRVRMLGLTRTGMREFSILDRASSGSIAALLGSLSGSEREELIRHMERIMVLLGGTEA